MSEDETLENIVKGCAALSFMKVVGTKTEEFIDRSNENLFDDKNVEGMMVELMKLNDFVWSDLLDSVFVMLLTDLMSDTSEGKHFELSEDAVEAIATAMAMLAYGFRPLFGGLLSCAMFARETCSGSTSKEYIQELEANLQKMLPYNVKVVTSEKELKKKLAADMAAGRNFDVFNFGGNHDPDRN